MRCAIHLATAFVLSLAALPAQDPALTASGKWHHFIDETASPVTLAPVMFNAAVSQATNSDPRYGLGRPAFGQRIAASAADIASQNFFSDFLLASAFHEDTRYFRRGPEYRFWSRVGYAVSRSVVVRKDQGGDTFNWANVAGTAMSVGLSNAYYPSASRTSGAMALHFATSVAGAGFGNLAPEFWPDVRHWLKRHL